MAEKWDKFGAMTDSEVLAKMMECEKVSGLPKEEFWAAHPLARHMRDKTKPKLSKGCRAPDAKVYTLEGQHLGLHEVINNAGGGVALPYTLLNFGSYT